MSLRIAAAILLAMTASSARADDIAWFAHLDGTKAVPPNATTASGIGRFTRTPTDVTCLLYATFAAGQCRIRSGAPGSNGPIVATIPQKSGGMWYGTMPLSAPTLADLEAGHLYAEIFSPIAMIRGQVTATFSTSGNGCPDSAGIPTWKAGGDTSPGAATQAQSIVIVASNAAPGSSGLILAHVAAANLPLPGGCTLLVSPDVPLVLPVGLAGGGWNSGTLSLPASLPAPLDVHMQLFSIDPLAPNGQYGASGRLTMHVTAFPN